MTRSIVEVASVIRSKNSGPYELTLDILFKNPKSYEEVKAANAITARTIAALYSVPLDHILDVIWFPPANAVKITMKRQCPSGHREETDIYGAQQHAPLLGLTY